jgi:hypothetical protein
MRWTGGDKSGVERRLGDVLGCGLRSEKWGGCLQGNGFSGGRERGRCSSEGHFVTLEMGLGHVMGVDCYESFGVVLGWLS